MKFISIILIILFFLLQYRLWVGNGSMTDVHNLEQAKQAQIEENKQLMERNESFAAEVYDLKNGYEAIEERARSEMGMIKNDETFYQVIKQRNPEEKQE
ncbi:MAG: cell division protein FtsB [Gammaproteobacteria bacterium]|nr:cell division protein FtsB [Gammaproteobacteria bacterium]